MAVAQEKVKLRQGIKCDIGGTLVSHLRSIGGGGILIPQVDTTSSGSSFQEFSTGRASFEPLKVVFANAKDNLKIIAQAAEYFLDPQNKPRVSITVTEITRDGSTAGAAINFFECFCTKLRLPTGNAQEGVLTTEMEFSIHRADHTGKGGVS